MITLENISTIPFTGIKSKKNYSSISNIINDLNITNFGLLKEFLQNNPQYQDFNELKELLNQIEMKLDLLKKLNIKSDIYRIEYETDFKDNITDKIVLDKSVMGSDLIFDSPFKKMSKTKEGISKYSIYQLKEYISHCDIVGTNLLKKDLSFINESDIYKILNAIYLYEEQLNRILAEENNIDTLEYSNLFKMHYNDKKELITEEIKEIAEYIGDNATEFIWGKFSYIELSYILYGAYSISEKDILRKDAFIHMLANYTTIGEAEKGLVRTRAIDRFIKKDNQQ